MPIKIKNITDKEKILLREKISYDRLTGEFRWVDHEPTRNKKPFGGINFYGYKRVFIKKKQYLLHRVAWFLSFGEYPEKEIDHINGIRTDNRLSNLRLSTRSENMRNTSRGNKNGFVGITKLKTCNRWLVSINTKKRTKRYVGSFECEFKAAMAYHMVDNNEPYNEKTKMICREIFDYRQILKEVEGV